MTGAPAHLPGVTPPVRPLPLGSVLGQSLAILGRNLVAFTVLGLIMSVPAFLLAYGTYEDLGITDDREEMLLFWSAVSLMAGYAADQLLAAPIIYGVVQDLAGQRAGVLACVGKGLWRLVPVLFTVFLYYWCVVFGFYTFVVPGFVLATGLYVAVPVAVCERRGVFGTLGRSFELTEGNRGRVFVLLLLFWGIRWGARAALLLSVDDGAALSTVRIALIVCVALDVVTSVVGAVLQGVVYARLREVRDGRWVVAELSQVFA